MSILIKGMEMPKSDSVITVKIYGDGRTIQTREQRPGLVITGMNALVGEAVELPPHGRLIDADELTTDRKDAIHKGMIFGGQVVYTQTAIDNAPTVIEAEGEK